MHPVLRCRREPVTDPIRDSVGGGAGAVARMRLVARRRAAMPERVVDRGRGRGAVRGDEQLDRVDRAGADLDLLGRSRARAAPRGRSGRRASGSKASTPSIRSTWGTRLSANRVSRAEVGGRGEALQVQVGGGELRALEERHDARRRRASGRAQVGDRGEPLRQRDRRAVPAAGEREERPPSPTHARRARSARSRTAPSARAPGPARTSRRPRRRRAVAAPPPSTGRGRAARPRRCGSPTARAACAASGTSPSRS